VETTPLKINATPVEVTEVELSPEREVNGSEASHWARPCVTSTGPRGAAGIS
jgi:hypothetical protein